MMRGQFRLLLVNAESQTKKIFDEAARLIGAELTAHEAVEQAARSVGDDRFEAIFVDPSSARFSRQGFTSLVRNSRFNSATPIVLISPFHRGGGYGEEMAAGVSNMARPSKSGDLLPFLEALKQKLMADRRKDRRLAFRTSVNCIQGPRRLKATSVNVSVTGILVEMSWAPDPGVPIALEFQLATGEPAFRGGARMVRREDEGRLVFAFQNLNFSQRERLRRFVDGQLPALRWPLPKPQGRG